MRFLNDAFVIVSTFAPDTQRSRDALYRPDPITVTDLVGWDSAIVQMRGAAETDEFTRAKR